MPNGDTTPIRTSDTYNAERDRILAEIEARQEDANDLPIGLRGLYRVGLKIAKIILVPLLAMIASTSRDVKEGIDAVATGEALKVEVKVDNSWWKDVLVKYGFDSKTIGILEGTFTELQTGPVWLRSIPMIMMVVGLFGRLSAIASGEPAKDLMRRFHPNVPSSGEIIRAAFIDPSRYEQVVKALQQNGLSETDIDLLFVNNYQLYPEQYTRALYYRGALTIEQANNRLSELGYTPERIAELKQGWPVIPGIQDLIMMQAKEAFEPELVSKYGLGAEEPTDIYEWTRKLGLPDEWTQRYWSSHWQHASYGQVMEMLHRGYIDEKSVYDWYKLVEIPPYWRDLLTKIAYSPYTRVDVRRMHAAGVIGDEALVQAMKDIGYDQEHAEKMAEFYKKYNAGSDKELSRTDIEKAFEDGDLNYPQAIGIMVSIGYDEAIADFYLSRIELEKERAKRLERIELTKEKFLSNLITEVKARNELVAYGVEISRINELIDRWRVQIIKNAKLPSKTDLDKFVRANVIDQDGYIVEMTKLGYSEYYIGLYWQTLKAGGAIE